MKDKMDMIICLSKGGPQTTFPRETPENKLNKK